MASLPIKKEALAYRLSKSDEWDFIVSILSEEIDRAGSRALSCENWDEVCEERGYARGLRYLANRTLELADIYIEQEKNEG